MACPAVTTGSAFLVEVLAHLDCQAQTLGSFGFQSLAAPGSLAGTVLTALLTLFVAIYGIRLLFGFGDEGRNLVNAALKVGIVLTIATSWPAWRVVAFDVVFYGPPNIAATIMPSTMPDPRSSLPQRLQGIDTGMAALTIAGTGRETGQIVDPNGGFRSIALTDETGLGWARPIFLASTVGSLAALRIAGGFLLALAPLIAGLLLFDLSRGVFVGWLRGLAFVVLGSLGTTIVLAIQIAVLEPWIADALNRRALGYATPTMPTELLALTLAFAVALVGTLSLLARVAFHGSWVMRMPAFRTIAPQQAREASSQGSGTSSALPIQSRAAAIGESVTTLMRREEATAAGGRRLPGTALLKRSEGESSQANTRVAATDRLGSSARRSARRETHSQRSRDEQG